MDDASFFHFVNSEKANSLSIFILATIARDCGYAEAERIARLNGWNADFIETL